MGNTTKESVDCLCRLIIKDNSEYNCWNVFAFNNQNAIKAIYSQREYSGIEIIQFLKDNPGVFSVEYTPFLEIIQQSMKKKGWVDIENDYYRLLKYLIDNHNLNSLLSIFSGQ